jgi:hypothetical protein
MARRGAERVQEGDAVVLSVNGGARHALICAQPGATVRLGKHAHASAADVVGAPYGSTLELSPSCSSLQRVRNARDPPEAGGAPEPSPAEEGKSNKQLTDSNSKQSLSSSDIHQLKQHHTGDAIVHSLAKNSVSFEEKTVFSQVSPLLSPQRALSTIVILANALLQLLCQHAGEVEAAQTQAPLRHSHRVYTLHRCYRFRLLCSLPSQNWLLATECALFATLLC